MPRNSDPFEALVADWEPRLREAFLKAIRDITNRVNVSLIARMLEEGNIEGAVRAVGMDPVDFRLLDQAIAQAFNAGGNAYEEQIPKVRTPDGALLEFRFDARNPQAEEWVRTRSTNLITGDIIEDQRNTIRQHLTAGLEAGQNPRTTALDLVGRKNSVTGLRDGGVIGLTSAQEEWQRRYEAELASGDPHQLKAALQRGLRDKRYDAAIRKAIASGKAIPADRVAAMLAAYRNRSLKYRADLIAKQETLEALSASQREAYRQAIERGQVQAQNIARYAITAGDERVRYSHREIPKMNKDGVGFDEQFQTPDGPRMKTPFDVGCRCHIVYRINYGRGLL
jgi:hypothetical protein